MFAIDWQLASEIATTVSTIAVAAGAFLVVLQLRQASRERYFSVTAHLFEIWQSPEFQHDQLFLLHKMSCPSWEEFCAGGRGEAHERALHRVGGFYDRIGNLVRHGLIRKDDMLPTIGGYAVAVWHRIEPLVKELRLRENALLFENYEALLPECHECYVPGLEATRTASPAAVPRLNASSPTFCPLPAERIPALPATAPGSGANGAKSLSKPAESPALAGTGVEIPATIPDVSLPDSDGVTRSISEFIAVGAAVLVYVRGAWCPFCLRQLTDYGEKYSDFRNEGVEICAIAPESPRRLRRMRKQLKLPFPLLSDAKLELARSFNLLGHEKPDAPTPATIIVDSHRGVLLSSFNNWAKCVVARDALSFMRARKDVAVVEAAPPPPPLGLPKPGFFFLRGLMNLVAGVVVR